MALENERARNRKINGYKEEIDGRIGRGTAFIVIILHERDVHGVVDLESVFHPTGFDLVVAGII